MDAPISSSSSDDEFFDADSNNARQENVEERPEFVSNIGEGETEPNWGDSNEDFDRIYDNNEENASGRVDQNHGSVIGHLLSQVQFFLFLKNYVGLRWNGFN